MKFHFILLLLAFFVAPVVNAKDKTWCDSLPDEAVTELPTPLKALGKMECNALGQAIKENESWVWVQGMPFTMGLPGSVPAIGMERLSRAMQEEGVLKQAYFKEISVTAINKDKYLEKAPGLSELGELLNNIEKLYTIQTANQLGDKNTILFADFRDQSFMAFDCLRGCERVVPKFSVFPKEKAPNQKLQNIQAKKTPEVLN